jgi:hypothetical protein
MKTTELPNEIQDLINHLSNWDTAISEDVASILLKLWSDEALTRYENNLDVTPAELAAIWSITNRTAIKSEYVRQVKRNRRIAPSKEWGTGMGYRCFYKVKTVKDVKVGHSRGRPRTKNAKNAA